MRRCKYFGFVEFVSFLDHIFRSEAISVYGVMAFDDVITRIE
jgi:hypothetical protein